VQRIKKNERGTIDLTVESLTEAITKKFSETAPDDIHGAVSEIFSKKKKFSETAPDDTAPDDR